MVPAPQCSTGSVSICVVADADNVVNSPGCDLNSGQCGLTTLSVSHPDLQFAGASKPQTVVGGVSFAINFTVANAGNAVAVAPWTDTIYLSTTPQFNAGSAIPIAVVLNTNTLAPSSNYTQSAAVTLPADQAGIFYVFFQIDSGNAVPECGDKGNNLVPSPVPLQVLPTLYPDLALESVSAPATALAGQPITVTWAVTNVGTETYSCCYLV